MLLAAIACSACTSYHAVTPPLPGRSASLDNAHDQLTVSQGVALGFECVTAWGNPCTAGQATIDDQKVAKVYSAHLNHLEGFLNGVLPPTSYVVVGVNPGRTTLHIPGESALRVVVVP
jgi:hypothetical protein